MTPLLLAYATGLVCLAVLYVQHLVDRRKPPPAMWRVAAPAGEKAELAVAARQFYRPRPERYVGRHCAAVEWNTDTSEMFLPDFDGDVGPYAPKAGVGAYVHLRTAELDAAAERDARRLKPHEPVDLEVLRLRTSTMPRVAEHDDEWAVA